MPERIEIGSFFRPLNQFEVKHAPAELFLEGDRSLLSGGLRVSVVGTRKPTKEGVIRCRALVKALVEQDAIIVSGLAEGIDTVAHTTAIESGGKTIAVLGTPLSKCFPAANKALLERIKAGHLAVSQFPEGYPGGKDNFPRRNRTMALISDATIIVEAGEKSGTRHQGWEAIRLGRLVFIMASVASNRTLTWPSAMISYGAQVLDREDLPELSYDIPRFTSGTAVAF